MKFCFFGYDHTLDIAINLIKDGHELLRIFTFPCDNQFVHNTQIHDFAKAKKIPITEEKITPEDVEYLIDIECELFLSCGYTHKIPIIPKPARGINLHPTVLPSGRGIMPLPYIIMHEPQAAGFTIHKMTQQFDAGDIIFQKKIKINETTDIETLAAKIALKTQPAISKIVDNFEEYWDNAQAQNHDAATVYPEPDEEFRTLNWSENAQTLNKKSRAFGRFGILANVTNNMDQTQKLAVYNASAWQENHEHKEGALLRSSPNEIVIAILDGYICLKEFQIIG